MKNIVVFDEYNQIDLKPPDLINEYTALVKKDVAKFFIQDSELIESACPACGSKDAGDSFERFGMLYSECNKCHTLYISRRPPDERIDSYYRNSQARMFWRNQLSRTTGRKRRDKIIKPRFEWIAESVQEYLPSAKSFADLNTDHSGYIEELAKSEIFAKKVLINPFIEVNSEGLEVLRQELPAISPKGRIDVISLFELLDRTSDIDSLVKNLADLLSKGGLIFITSILITGFDLQILWEKAGNIYPPDRLNLFSLEGIKILLSRHGFECLEVSTPGILDLEIVDKALKQHPDIEVPRFVRYILENKGVQTRKEFQEFLQANLLSSYARILARKK